MQHRMNSSQRGGVCFEGWECNIRSWRRVLMIFSEEEWKSQPRQKVSQNFLPFLSFYCRLTELLLCRLDTAAERGAANTDICATSERGKKPFLLAITAQF